MAKPLSRIERAATTSERVSLEAFLDDYRAIILSKVDRLADQDARRHLVASPTTVAGIVKHLRWVEVGWFHQVLGDRTGEHRRPHDREWEFEVDQDDNLDRLVAAYEEACERSRAIAAAHALEDLVPHRRMGQVSVRWIYLHLTEETARHAGHIDILRELLDGATGFR